MYLMSYNYNSYIDDFSITAIQPPEYMKDRLKRLLDTSDSTDCSFTLQDPHTGKDVTIRGHQFQLAMISPVFRTMFYEQFLDHNILIEGVEPRIFQLFLEVTYMQEPVIESPVDAVALYGICKKFNAKDSLKFVQRWIRQNCTPKNAIILYECAKEQEDKQIEEKCLLVSLLNLFFFLVWSRPFIEHT